jgi:acetoin utilization protein AcuA
MALSAIDTDKGTVTVCARFPAGGYDALAFGLDTSDPAYQPIYTRKQTLEQFAQAGGAVCLALFRKRIIIGFAVIGQPAPDSRWARAGPNGILELKAVEVARPFRNQGIAGHLLTHLFSGSAFNDHIVFLTAYAWLWDTDHTGLSCGAYREMLMTLYAGFGFESCQTNEPNVCLKPENIFMARIGKNVSSKERERFKWMRFGIFPPVQNQPFGSAVDKHDNRTGSLNEKKSF